MVVWRQKKMNVISKNPKVILSVVLFGVILVLALWYGGVSFVNQLTPYVLFGALLGFIPFLFRFFASLLRKSMG